MPHSFALTPYTHRRPAKKTSLLSWALGLCAVFATQLRSTEGAATYTFTPKTDFSDRNGESPCTHRVVSFAGFGALETNQCDPIIQITGSNLDSNNQTVALNVGLAYFELSQVKHYGGSDTTSQVLLECLEKRLEPTILPYVVGAAQFDNPPLNPFPSEYNGVCKITVDEWVIRGGSGKHATETHERRYVDLFIERLNPALCSRVIDYINSQGEDCHNSARVSQLDAGKAFLTLALMIAAGLTLVGGVGLCYAAKDMRCPRRNGFFGASFDRDVGRDQPPQFFAPNREIRAADLEAQNHNIAAAPHKANPTLALMPADTAENQGESLEGQPNPAFVIQVDGPEGQVNNIAPNAHDEPGASLVERPSMRL